MDRTEITHLLENLQQFNDWLFEKKVIKKAAKVRNFSWPFANADWIMKVRGHDVSFNTFVRKQCTFDFYLLIVLHEYFHLVVQKVPNKEDATTIKDDFGIELMKLIDIEADFFAALFFKQHKGYSAVKYFSLMHEGASVFRDSKIRTFKFERFIGSTLSVGKMLVKSQPKKGFTCDLYLPTIGPIYTENSLHVLVVKKEHIYFDPINAEYSDFVSIKRCYSDASNLSRQQYVSLIMNFINKALNIKSSKTIQDEIKNIPGKTRNF
jgi:hypothetical protein